MKMHCPKTCMALQHPEAGFSIRNLSAGEEYIIESGACHHFVFLLSGELRVSSEERRDYKFSEAHLVLCYKDYEYRFVALSDVRIVVVYFTSLSGACDIGMLTRIYRNYEDMRYEFAAVAFNEPMREFLTLMTRFLTDSIECKHMHYSSLQQLFIIFRFYYPPKTLLKLFYNVLDNDLSFKTLVINNRAKARTLNELASLCGYDISTFNVVFRRHFKNITPYEWMQEFRSKEVLHCICTTDLTVSDIAEQFGFSNAGHLSLFCKKYLGDTPGRLRQKHKEKN